MKSYKALSVSLSLLIMLVMVTFLTGSAAAATYTPLTVPVGRDNEVNELGTIFAQFTGDTLQDKDSVIFSLPPGFIWTNADLRSDKEEAEESRQTTSDWNNATFEADFARYGTSNYFLVPREYNGHENGLFKESEPVLYLSRLNDRDVLMKIVSEPLPLKNCYFYLYAERVFVDDGFNGNVTIKIDTPSGSGFAGQTTIGSTVECTEVPDIFAGVPGQKIGTVIIKEASKGSLNEGETLKLLLPEGSKWVKLADDSVNDLNISGTVSDDGRTAVFNFAGKSTAAATLTLEDMEITVKAGTTGSMKARVSGSGGLTGELTVANITPPTALFTVDKTEYEINGAKNTMDAAPFIKDDRVFLPLRYFARAVGVTDDDIIWNQAARSIEIRHDGTVVKLQIGSDLMYVDNLPVQMDTAPEIVSPGRTMLPLRWAAEALDREVYWDEAARQVRVLN